MINFVKLFNFLTISILITQSEAVTTRTSEDTTPDQPICSQIRGPYAIDLVQCARALNNVKASGDPDEPNQLISIKNQTFKISCGNCGITLEAESTQEIKTTTDGAQITLNQIFQNCTGGYGQMKIPIQSTNLQFENNVNLIINPTNSESC
ncbi:secreted protein [Melampsora americana]|nr:secreted protein [Melampsora americana]